MTEKHQPSSSARIRERYDKELYGIMPSPALLGLRCVFPVPLLVVIPVPLALLVPVVVWVEP